MKRVLIALACAGVLTSHILAQQSRPGDEAEVHVTATVFSLEVNVTLELVVFRDQPSGTRTRNPPAVERYGTN